MQNGRPDQLTDLLSLFGDSDALSDSDGDGVPDGLSALLEQLTEDKDNHNPDDPLVDADGNGVPDAFDKWAADHQRQDENDNGIPDNVEEYLEELHKDNKDGFNELVSSWQQYKDGDYDLAPDDGQGGWEYKNDNGKDEGGSSGSTDHHGGAAAIGLIMLLVLGVALFGAGFYLYTRMSARKPLPHSMIDEVQQDSGPIDGHVIAVASPIQVEASIARDY